MEKKLVNKKKLAIGGGIAAAAIIVAAAALLLWPKGYRTIQIYRLDGRAEVTREAQAMEPYVNMMLESEDHVATFEESYLYLKMDDDKYMLAEPQTQFSIEAAGTRKDSQTTIHLEIGAVTNHITEPLSAKSSYEVTTPNSVMAVRGTSFRVVVWFDENGVSHTMLQVFEGVVEVHLLYPDGSLSEEGRLFHNGQTVTIWGNDITSDYDRVEDEIDYFSLDIPVLEFLKIGIRDLDDYDITMAALDEVIRLKQTYFDVTFTVDGRVFGTQSVLFDHYAHEPSLRPTPNGRWDFDFSTAIREAAEVPWIEG